MNRKALGALTCTFILIGLSMVLGLIFMSWGKNYIEQRAEFVVGVAGGKAGCSDLNLRFIEVNGVKQVCTAGNQLKFMIENIGNTAVSELQGRIVDGSGVRTLDQALGSAVQIGESTSVLLDMTPPAKQAKFTPVIYVSGKREYCFDKALSADAPFAPC